MQARALLKDSYRVGQAIVRVLGDSTKTQEIHRVEEIINQPRIRALLAQLTDTPDGRRLLTDRPELTTKHVDFARLRALPATSFGGAYARHLDTNGISADYEVGTRYVEDPIVAYYMVRFRQTHDIWHTLLGLGIAGHEEVVIHSFSYGQLRLPHSAMIMALGGVKHLVMERRWGALRHSMLDAYRAGREAAPLMAVYWEDLWEAPLETVRAAFNVQPLERRWLD